MTPNRGRRGFTLIEIMIVVGIVAVIATLTTIQMGEWFTHQRVKAAARSGADAFQLARSEAIRTGSNHIVFFGSPGSTDPAGTLLTGTGGGWVPILILNDGAPGTANCKIDGGEETRGIPPVDDVWWGVSHATSAVPDDRGSAHFSPPQSVGNTFSDPANNPVSWVLFRPDGIPVAFAYDAGTSSCGQIGQTGSSGAALYITNGERDYAVVLSALGAVRVHRWEGGGWSS
jgi:prepilin-type N-terminal cleavage/methylation domain-containing protein